MMSQPTSKQVKTGAAILNAPQTAGGPQVIARQGDAVCHANGSGWHVCMVPSAIVPVGGLPANQSTDQFRWSQGASYSGMGVPQSYSPPTFDAAQSGIGTDGRIFGGANGTPTF